ncbi:CNPY2 [Bugula neritina]|uniref:CNPY2 n=1 Tax=Bugula neritina TaxID=10212 RepID=A0A7J7KMP6_BUGNE|nr:CNPY2 [Bugula neritina]
MMSLLWFNILLLMSAIMAHAKDMDLYCGACHMLVDEIHWEINQTDPKRTIQVGSFRIMPDGSQRLSEQSTVQLTDLLETACSKPGDYYQSVDKLTNTKIYKRQNRRDGQPASLKNLTLSKDIMKMLKFACEGIAEDFEEEIITVFRDKENENYLQSICVSQTELCKESQLYDVNPDVVEDEDNPDDIESNNQESDTEVKTEL